MSANRYEFGAATEDRTVVVGLRGSQVIILGVGLTVAVGIVRATGGSAASFAFALAVVGLSAATSLWPVAGRTADEWIPVVSAWAAKRLLRRHREVSALPLLGHHPDGTIEQQPPATLAGCEILAVPIDGSGGPDVGVVHDRRADTYSAVLSVRGRSFQLADTPDRQRRLAAWGGLLAGLARASSPVHRIQWVERTAPEDADAMGRYLADARRVPRDHPTLESYLELVDQAGPAPPAHESLLVVSVATRHARRAIKQAGGGHTGATQVLVRELIGLRRQLAAADLAVDGILTPRLVAGAMRSAFEPHSRAALSRRATAGGDEAGTDPANAWPLGTGTSWSTYRTADVWHATYWIAQWPRSGVGADFLAPLLLGTTAMRTVSVTMQPISPQRAHREVEHAVLKSQADEELRSNAGFVATARRRRAQETAERREQELADGHADYRLSGTSPSPPPQPTRSKPHAARSNRPHSSPSWSSGGCTASRTSRSPTRSRSVGDCVDPHRSRLAPGVDGAPAGGVPVHDRGRTRRTRRLHRP